MLVPLLAACGGKASGTAGEQSQGGSSTGGTSAVAGTSSTGGTSAVAGTSSGGAVNECTRYDDESPIPVDVTLINKTGQTLYLGQQMSTCGITPLFSVATAAGQPLPSVGDCRVSCAGARVGVGGCPAICAFPNTIELQPGESHYTMWDSLYRVDASLPARCLTYEGAQGDAMCMQAKRIEAGDYTFSAVAGLKVDCSMTSSTTQCGACTPDPNGGCSIAGGLIAAQKLNATTAVTLDASYGFSAPAAGPSPGAGDAAPGALPNAHVELIFTE